MTMPEPTKATKGRIKSVAVLRTEGVSWAEIAKRFKYASADSACKQMTWEHADLWREEYERARALYLDDVESEALLTQRQLLRCDDLRIRQSAAHSLLAHCAKLRAQKLEVSGPGGVPLFKAYVGVDTERV